MYNTIELLKFPCIKIKRQELSSAEKKWLICKIIYRLLDTGGN